MWFTVHQFNLQCTYLQGLHQKWHFVIVSSELPDHCGTAEFLRNTSRSNRWPRNCLITRECVHTSPFPSLSLSNKRGNSFFLLHDPRPVQSVFWALCPRNCDLPCIRVPFAATMYRWVNWQYGWSLSASTHSSLQYCFRTHCLQLPRSLCIKWPVFFTCSGTGPALK